MNITRFSVTNVQFTLVVVVAMLVIGVNSLFTISKAEDPTFPIPIVTVAAVLPGASPTDLEQLVVDPIEKRLKELDDLKELTTTIEDGVAFTKVEFTSEADAPKKYEEVIREVNALRPSLPSSLARLEVKNTNASDVNIVQLALVSPSAPMYELDIHARALRDALSRVPGVKKSTRQAAAEREARVSLDLGRLAELKLPMANVLQAIGSENVNIPGGSVDVGLQRYNVKTSGSYATLDEVGQTVVGGGPGGVVRLQDVATVAWVDADPTHIGRYNGVRAVWVTASAMEGENTMDVRDRIWKALDAWEPTLPAGIRLERGFDQSRNVRARLSALGKDFGLAILLVLVTLLPLGMRAAGIVMVSIPLSLAIGVTLLKSAGFSINQLSIVGFVIALGLLVDDSIVVVENIARYIRNGMGRVEAAIAATKQITLAVLGFTATLVLAFVPLLLLPGNPGKFIRGLPAAVVFTVLASLFVSLTVIPFLASIFLKDGDEAHENIFLRLLSRGIDLTYSRLLHHALLRPKTTLVAALALFVGAMGLIPVVGLSLFPKAGTPQYLVQIHTPGGSSLAATDSATRFVERALIGRPDVQSVFSNTGKGNPEIYYNIWQAQEKSNIAELFVVMKSFNPKTSPIAFDSLRARFDAYPNARIELREFENGPPIEAPIAIRLTGERLDTLRSLAARLEGMMAATPGTRTVVNPVKVSRTDLRLRIDHGKTGLLGVPTGEIDRTVRLGIAGIVAGQVRAVDGREYDISVRVPTAGRPTPEVLDRTYVPSVTGATVPLRSVASLAFESSPTLISHLAAERSVVVTSQVRSGYNTNQVTSAILDSLSAWQLPTGYRALPEGEIKSRQESFGGLGTAVLLAIFGIVAVLVLEFRTFTGTMIVASVIPLGAIGAILALLVTGNTLSFTAMIGFVALIGIEIKNSILLVDLTNQLREEGMGLDEAIEQSGRIRFLPVVLTTMTAIGGMLPLAMQGSGLYSPLADVLIGGLLSSMLLSRLVTPVMYKLLPPAVGARAEPVATPAPSGAMPLPA